MVNFENLSDEEKEFYYDKASEFFEGRDLLYCTRVWSAWNIGTMRSDDFYSAEGDDDLIKDLAEHIYDIVKVKIRKSKIKNILQ